MKRTSRFLAALMAAVMFLTAAPLSGLYFSAAANSSVSDGENHEHTKTTSVKKATLSKNGAKTVTCRECKKTLNKTTIYKIATVKLKKTSYTYSGKAIKPAVTAKDSKGKTLKAGTDYTVTYKNNKAAGKATATVTFKGSYSGKKTLTFSILPKITVKKTASSITASWTKVSGAKSYGVYLYKGSSLVKSISTSKTSTKFTGLSSNTGYTVTVKAKNSKSETLVTAKAAAKTSKASSGGNSGGSQQSYTVYITKSGSKFHRSSCPTLKKSRSIYSISRSSAVSRGYGACKVCKP